MWRRDLAGVPRVAYRCRRYGLPSTMRCVRFSAAYKVKNQSNRIWGVRPALAACKQLLQCTTVKTALTSSSTAAKGGLGFNMWATLVANDGTVCAVAFSGSKFTDQWLGSRVISAQKANTANDFSLGP